MQVDAGRIADAFRWQVMDPESHAERLAGEINAAFARLDDVLRGMPVDIRERVCDRARRLLRDWIDAESRCASPHVTGPARFDVERHKRARDRADALRRELTAFLDGGAIDWARKMVRRREDSEMTPADRIARDIEATEREAVDIERRIDRLKRAVEAVRKVEAGAGVEDACRETGADAGDVRPALEYLGVHSLRVAIRNARGRLRRVQDRAARLRARLAAAESGDHQSVGAAGSGVQVIEDVAADRLRIVFQVKPSREIIDTLKRHGFRWSPRNRAWQRKLTNNARWAAKQVLASL